MDQVSSNVTNERVAVIFFGIGPASVNGDTGRRSEVAHRVLGGDSSGILAGVQRQEFPGAAFDDQLVALGLGTPLLPNDPPRFGRTCPVDRSTGAVASDASHRTGRSEPRIARQVLLGKHYLLHVVAVTADESLSPIVH